MYQHENTAFTHTSNSQPPSKPNLYITTDEAEDLIDKVSATLLTQHRTAQQWVNEKKKSNNKCNVSGSVIGNTEQLVSFIDALQDK